MTLLPSMRTKEQLLEDEKALLAEIEQLRETIEAMAIYNGTQLAEIGRLREENNKLRSDFVALQDM